MISRFSIVQFGVLLAIGMNVVTTACFWPNQGPVLRVLPLEIEGRPADPRVTVSGQWQPQQSGMSVITRINAATLTCNRPTMKCHESIAMVTSPTDRLATSGSLYAVLFEYDVKKWGTVIEAAGSTRAANLTVLIDLEKKVVTRTMAETTERGATTSNPSTEIWVLR